MITYDELPHWFQPNAAVFMTFRTDDSMPRSAVLRMEAELRERLNWNGILVDDSAPLPEWAGLSGAFQQGYRQRKSRLWHGELDSCHESSANLFVLIFKFQSHWSWFRSVVTSSGRYSERSMNDGDAAFEMNPMFPLLSTERPDVRRALNHFDAERSSAASNARIVE